MSSIRRILANRANGRKSKGPVTPQGKSRSARNSVSHGLLARFVVMADESPDAFRELVDDHLIRFQPADGVEAGFIEEMAAAAWRLRRAWAMETRMLDNLVAAQTTGERLDRMAAVHSDPAVLKSLDLLLRYEARLHLMYQRALHNLLLARALEIPSEPNPIFEHSAPAIGLPGLPAPEES